LGAAIVKTPVHSVALCVLGISLTVTPPVLAQAQQDAQAGLSLQEFILKVRKDNRTILGKRAELDLAQTGIDRANAAFQPIFSVSALNSYSNQRNSPEERLTRLNEDNYERKGQDYTAAISGLLPTGAKVEFKTSLSRFMTNINRGLDGVLAEDYYNRSNYGVSITQPLLKDAGVETTAAKRRVAELDTRAAEHGGRETEITVVAEAAMAYYDLVFAQERVMVANERVEAGLRLLEQAIKLVEAGRLPQSDIWEVENSLGRYRAALSEAGQIQLDRSNRLRNFMTMGVQEAPTQRLLAADGLPEQLPAPKSFAESIGQARANRADLQMREAMVERELVQYNFSTNQSKPRLDLVANYGKNGLAFSSSDAFSSSNTRDYPNWTVGVQLSLPIGKNLQGQADLRAAAVRRSDAELALRALELAIGNDIETTLSLRESALERLSLLQDVATREQQYLELERTRLESGRSDMREILVREERAINARLAVAEQRLAAVKADLMLQAAQGVLLNRFQ
jgi:outer membrane protein TolC